MSGIQAQVNPPMGSNTQGRTDLKITAYWGNESNVTAPDYRETDPPGRTMMEFGIFQIIQMQPPIHAMRPPADLPRPTQQESVVLPFSSMESMTT